MTDTPAQAPADRFTTDLESIKRTIRPYDKPWRDSLNIEDVNALIAEVEALRKRVVNLEADYLRRHNEAVDNFERAIAAEARCGELARALEHIVKGNRRCPTPTALLAWAQTEARAALAATPEEVMERAKLIRTALEFYAADDARAVKAGVLESLDKRPATAALDTLKEGG